MISLFQKIILENTCGFLNTKSYNFINFENLSFMRKFILFIAFAFLFYSCDFNDEDDQELSTPLAICLDGLAISKASGESYKCQNYDLIGMVSLETMNATSANDSWGWTDPSTGKEYALIGLDNGTGFIDISDPLKPIYLGKLPTQTISTIWRDLKVYNNHVYIVADFKTSTPEIDKNHGVQVFDLTRLASVVNPPQTFTNDYLYLEHGEAHNIAINEESGYAYAVGTNTYSGGVHAIDLTNPTKPVLAGGFADAGYTHDAQVVTYKGPDSDYIGKEIYVGSNEDKVVILDVSDKKNIKIISEVEYSKTQYTHQGWFTNDQRFFIVGDELDEFNKEVNNTRSIIFDFNDLDNPKVHFEFVNSTDAIDHNGYVHKNKFYLASYTAGLRIIDVSNIVEKSMSEIGYFDTYNEKEDSGSSILSDSNRLNYSQDEDHDNPKKGGAAAFNGAWSVYPYFKSENIIISDINSGLFIVKKQN